MRMAARGLPIRPHLPHSGRSRTHSAQTSDCTRKRREIDVADVGDALRRVAGIPLQSAPSIAGPRADAKACPRMAVTLSQAGTRR